jgi:hypothetical protein
VACAPQASTDGAVAQRSGCDAIWLGRLITCSSGQSRRAASEQLASCFRFADTILFRVQDKPPPRLLDYPHPTHVCSSYGEALAAGPQPFKPFSLRCCTTAWDTRATKWDPALRAVECTFLPIARTWLSFVQSSSSALAAARHGMVKVMRNRNTPRPVSPADVALKYRTRMASNARSVCHCHGRKRAGNQLRTWPQLPHWLRPDGLPLPAAAPLGCWSIRRCTGGSSCGVDMGGK